MKLKKTISGVLAVTTLLLSGLSTLGNASAISVETKDTPAASGAAAPEASGTDYGLCDKIEDGVILHAWCWSFNTISANIDKIAAAGYTAIQTSPVSLCDGASTDKKLMGDLTTEYGQIGTFTGTAGDYGAWWWHYQFTDLSVGNYQLGNESDYINMCNAAHAKGIKIITDVVFNHTTRNLDNLSPNLLNAVGIDSNHRPNSNSDEWKKLYHDNWKTNITNYNDRNNCTMYSLDNLPDINTENKNYQAYVVKYLNRLVEDGCDGIRMDAVKHIAAPSEISGVTTDFFEILNGKQVTGIDNQTVSFNKPDNFFIYGEYLGGTTESLLKYTPYMKLTADGYGSYIREKVSLSEPSFSVVEGNQNGIGAWRLDSSIVNNGIVTWVESHDTYCNKHESASLTSQQIKMAWAAIAARKDGTPLFFSRPANSNSNNYWGDNTIGIAGNDHYKDSEVVAANKFRNAMASKGAAEETLRNINSNNGIYQIDRYKSYGNTSLTCGSCIINLTGINVNLNGYATSLADGTYTDMVTSNTVTVSNGKFTSGSVAAGKIATIYNTENESEQEEPIPGEDTNFDDYRYTYFFNSLGWTGSMNATLTDDSGSSARTLPLTFSNDLHCYYCKYPATGYTKISFNVGSNSTAQQRISPGMVFVPTTASTGTWILPSSIAERTIYFSSTDTGWTTGININLKNGSRENSGSMTKTLHSYTENGTNIYGADIYDYCYTYYYPMTNANDKDYATVQFVKDTSISTGDITIPSDKDKIYVYSRGTGSGTTYSGASTVLDTKSVSVNIAYTGNEVANSKGSATYSLDTQQTINTSVDITNGNIPKALSDASTALSMTSVFDDFTFYGSQFQYVSKIASLTDDRIGDGTLPYCAYVNPETLSKQSDAFSGVFGNSDNYISTLNSAQNNWVKYIDTQGDEISLNQIHSDFENLAHIEVYAFSKPKTYTVKFHYPTAENSSTVAFKNDTLFTNTSNTELYHCRYNELLENATSDIQKNMVIPTGKTFDGWYMLTIDNGISSYLKVSSEQNFRYRITDQNLDLYAVYRTSSTPPDATATALASSVDKYQVDGDTETDTGVRYRYNTVLNINDYKTTDGTVTDVAIVYAYGNTANAAAARSKITNDFINNTDTKTTTTDNNVNYKLYKYTTGSDGDVELTNKNRLQFVLTLKDTQVENSGTYSNVLAFVAYKCYDGTWVVSNNCVSYVNGKLQSQW